MRPQVRKDLYSDLAAIISLNIVMWVIMLADPVTARFTALGLMFLHLAVILIKTFGGRKQT
jgi:hypothetical protein